MRSDFFLDRSLRNALDRCQVCADWDCRLFARLKAGADRKRRIYATVLADRRSPRSSTLERAAGHRRYRQVPGNGSNR